MLTVNECAESFPVAEAASVMAETANATMTLIGALVVIEYYSMVMNFTDFSFERNDRFVRLICAQMLKLLVSSLAIAI